MTSRMLRKPSAIRAGLMVFALCAGGIVRADFRPLTAPLDDAALSQLRGGFLVGDLEIAIGLEQIISLNGEPRVVNQLSIPNLNATAPALELISTNQMIRQGMDNSFVLITNQFRPGAGFLTEIQNSLDQQVIQNMRTLNIELSNAGGVNGFIPALMDSHLLQSPGR